MGGWSLLGVGGGGGVGGYLRRDGKRRARPLYSEYHQARVASAACEWLLGRPRPSFILHRRSLALGGASTRRCPPGRETLLSARPHTAAPSSFLSSTSPTPLMFAG